MEINKERFEETLNKIDSAMGKISRIDTWLPSAMDEAINGHSGTLDVVDLDKIGREKKEEERRDEEINSLHGQLEESQKQTKEIKSQTKYLMWAFIATTLGLLFNSILQISPNLFGLINKLS